MPSITYHIRFTLRQPKPGHPYEEQEYIHIENAWAAFRLFAEQDSRWIYSRVELSEYNWEELEDTLIASMDFAN